MLYKKFLKLGKKRFTKIGKRGRHHLQEVRRQTADLRWQKMEQMYGNPLTVTHEYGTLLKRHGEARDLYQARGTYATIRRRRSTKHIIHLANLSIEMFGKCGSVREAREAFDVMANRVISMEAPSEISYVLMIQAYADNGYVDEARKVFLRMKRPHVVSWATMIFAYGDNGFFREARDTYDWAPLKNAILWTAMLKVYALNGKLLEAREFFDEVPQRNVLMRNAMIQAYGRAGLLESAKRMFASTKKRTVITFCALAEAYTLKGEFGKVKMLLRHMSKEMVTSWNVTIACYGRAGLVQEAVETFNSMETRNSVSWNALIATHGFNGHLHAAIRAFEEMPMRNLLSWNLMIEIYARNWSPRGAIWLSRLSNLHGFKPTHEGFIALLAACVQLRSLSEGLCLFHSMIEDYTIIPTRQHYYCMLDLLVHADHFEEAQELIDSMPFLPNQTAWKILWSQNARSLRLSAG